MAAQFGSAVQDFHGSRISTKELPTMDAPSKSTMGLVQSTNDLLRSAGDYRNTILSHCANRGKAHQLDDPKLSDAEYSTSAKFQTWRRPGAAADARFDHILN